LNKRTCFLNPNHPKSCWSQRYFQ